MYLSLEVDRRFLKEIATLPRLAMMDIQGFDVPYFTHYLEMDSAATALEQASETGMDIDDGVPSATDELSTAPT